MVRIGKGNITLGTGLAARVLAVLALLLVAWTGMARATSVSADSIAARLKMQQYYFPQEKIHVTTDKARYMSGDTVWLRAFVVNAATGEPVRESKYVYVELRNPFDSIARRVKIIERKGVYSGYIPLDRKLPEGHYTLVAYTMFMESLGQDFFFKKGIEVASIFSLRYRIDTRLAWKDGDGSPQLDVDIACSDRNTGAQVAIENMSYTLDDQKVHTRIVGGSAVHFALKGERDTQSRHMLVWCDDYGKYVDIPRPESEYMVYFMPEGGYLVPGVKCNVAVKALGSNGLGRRLEGTVKDRAGATVAHFATGHAGMAVFALTPERGQVYTATCTTPDGEAKTVTLPVPRPGAAVLHVTRSGDATVVVQPVGDVPAGATVVVQQRGALVKAGSGRLSLPLDSIEAGVVQCLLLDSRMRKLSERLFFAPGRATRRVDVNCDKPAYGRREKVDVIVDLHHYDVAAGDYAVSVTDNAYVPVDSATSIATQLLLQSELRGHIEDPGYYFRQPGREAELDALMLTQGWTRYDVPRALRGALAEPEAPLEKGYVATGRVVSEFRKKPMSGVTVQVIAPKVNYASSFTTDANGEFALSGMDFPDSVKLVMQVEDKGKRKYANVSLVQSTPAATASLPAAASLPAHVAKADEAYRDMESKRITALGGMTSILLQEVVVTANKPQVPEDIFETWSQKTIDYEEIERKGISSLEDVLRHLPGIIVKNGQAYLMRGGLQAVGFFIDGTYFETMKAMFDENPDPVYTVEQQAQYHTMTQGMSMTIEEYTKMSAENENVIKEIEDRYPLSTIKMVYYIPPGMATVFGRRGTAGGIVMIKTKDGTEKMKGVQDDLGLHMFIAQGYQRPAEFYSPAYSPAQAANGEGVDLRETLYWAPCLTTDRAGHSSFSFYTSDNSATAYTLTIEGITQDGELINKRITIDKR
ncbi:hypothetical protein [Sodaliphilus pleomorphus]|uniref:MG2 domain-containing protein n=2 Tax=Sodaliphilus pleomorphus TaxID=2606626 RepID=A0A6L5X8C4_9BACT|nr:hypothetical protein [Sodaliphilus pleomorphus]MSS16589.1 hypothetical protein [Sodaliphilus pleomorphus]